MSRAVLSKFTDADDDIQPAGNGALSRDRPDHERALEAVARERAIWAWGRLRGISVLDSGQAEEILTAAILEAVVASKKPMEQERRTFDLMRKAARKLRECVLRLWWDSKALGDLSIGSSKSCRICRGSKNVHDKSCIVGKALELVSQARIGEDE